MTLHGAAMALWLVTAGGIQSTAPVDPTPRPAAQFITDAFRTYPLVAFSEPGHGASGTREFFAALIRHPGFAGLVTDIVVECGNARYQEVADRYFAGEAVPRRELSQIWENTTVVSGVWHLPVYEEIFADIRAFNLTRPKGSRIRVLLGDPPIDWTAVRGPADEDMNDWRDAHFAWVVEQQVMKKGRKALIWIGGAHIGRKVILPDSLIHLLDRRFPEQTLVVHSIDRAQLSERVAAGLKAWPTLSAAPVRNTWLGKLETGAIGHHLSRGVVEEDTDAVVLWTAPSRSRDEPRRTSVSLGELRRRQQLAETTLAFRGGRIRFEEGAAVFSADAQAALTEVLAELKRDVRLHLLVKAFSDAREADGAQLSLQRASRVVSWLAAAGVDPARLTARGCGASRALFPGDTEEERAANRRAELVRNSARADCQPPSSFAVR